VLEVQEDTDFALAARFNMTEWLVANNMLDLVTKPWPDFII